VGRRVGGGDVAGPELNDLGREQARRLAQVLPRFLPELAPEQAEGVAPVLVASPMLRAAGTAQILGPALGVRAAIDQDWAELRFGDWEGLGYAEIARRWPEHYRAWCASPSLAPPGGESLDAVTERIGAALRRLTTGHPGATVIVVTHTAPIRAVLAAALEAGPAAFWRLRLDPASLSVVRFWADGGCEVAGVNLGQIVGEVEL
jgi:probable phosphoglycerate mutase